MMWLLLFLFSNPIYSNDLDIYEVANEKIDEREDQYFSHITEHESGNYLSHMNEYMGLSGSGEKLINSCREYTQIRYDTIWKKRQAIRLVHSYYQHYGLDLTSRAISTYAHTFNFTKKEYKNLVTRLVGNYCSKNITVIGVNHLEQKMLDQFDKANQFKLPTIKSNPLFPFNIKKESLNERGRINEFSLTIKLFRAFCSWGGGDNPRLIVPLLKNPILMSFFIRQMEGKKLHSDQEGEKLEIINSPPFAKIHCQYLICRPGNNDKFIKYFPKSVYFRSVEEDMEHLYCTHFKDLVYGHQDEPHIKQWLRSHTFDDDNLMIQQFVALLTGMPDFIVWSDNYQELQKIVRASLDVDWMNWAINITNNMSQKIPYEESVRIRVADRKNYFNKIVPKFKVVLDINAGEYDRAVESKGKIKANMDLELSRSMLRWYRTQWQNTSKLDIRKRKKLINQLKQHLSFHLKKKTGQFLIIPWKGELEKLLAFELISQLNLYTGGYFDEMDSDERWVTISVEFRYGMFALKYFRYRFLSERVGGIIDL